SLRKDPHKRLRDIGDALMEIESTSTNVGEPKPSARKNAREQLAWIAAAVLVIALIVMTRLYVRSGPAPLAEPGEFTVAPADGSFYTGGVSDFAISPDGRHLAFAASKQGVSMLWVRSLSTSELRVLPGTEGARFPFWKPDSEALGFFANRQLKTVRL